MGKFTLVALVYSPIAVLFTVLAYYWNYLVLLKRSDKDI